MSFEGEELLGCVVVAGNVLIFSSVQAVPMARTTRPDSPSRSKHCRYPTTAFPPISSTFRPIFLCNSPTTETQMHLDKHHMSQENIDRSVSDCTCICLQRQRKQSSSKSSVSRWSYPKQLKAHLVRVDQYAYIVLSKSPAFIWNRFFNTVEVFTFTSVQLNASLLIKIWIALKWQEKQI